TGPTVLDVTYTCSVPEAVRSQDAPMPKAKTKKKPKYEPVLQLPPLSYEEFTALRDNIAVNGVLVPILVDCNGPRRRIIDGNYRKMIADQLGYDCPEVVVPNLTDEELRI